MSLLWLLILVLVLSAITMVLTKLAYHWPAMAEARIHPEPHRKLRGAKLYRRVVGNMLLSAGIIFALSYTFQDHLIVGAEISWFWAVLHAIGILLVYDFFYYLMHRFAFHEWEVLRRVHVVHHLVRHPHSIDSLYLHPAETFLGLALLFSCTAGLGPVHPLTFGLVLFVHSQLNILVHSGLDLPFFPFRALSFLARKHDIHHISMKGGNYASLTPIYDRLFGTAE